MNYKVVLGFVAGLLTGAAATFFITKKIHEDEIEQLKEDWGKTRKISNPVHIENEVKAYLDKNKPELMDYYKQKLEQSPDKYWKSSKDSTNEEKEVTPKILQDRKENEELRQIYNEHPYEEKPGHDVTKPYIITPEELGEEMDYSLVALIYYADGVLADDFDNVVDNEEYYVGSDYKNHFGEYETNTVHVRNDELMCDYEITQDFRKFSDVIKMPGGYDS